MLGPGFMANIRAADNARSQRRGVTVIRSVIVDLEEATGLAERYGSQEVAEFIRPLPPRLREAIRLITGDNAHE
jgi:hypothetical protein